MLKIRIHRLASFCWLFAFALLAARAGGSTSGSAPQPSAKEQQPQAQEQPQTKTVVVVQEDAKDDEDTEEPEVYVWSDDDEPMVAPTPPIPPAPPAPGMLPTPPAPGMAPIPPMVPLPALAHGEMGLLIGRGYLGVDLTDLTPDLRRHFGAPPESGVMVGHVESGSPADKAGLRVGDIITTVDGRKTRDTWNLARAVRQKTKGQTAALEVVRDGKGQKLTVQIDERERRVVDVRRMVREHPGSMEMDAQRMAEDAMGPAMEAVGRARRIIGDPQLEERLVRLRGAREKALEKKLEALEKKLDDLQKRFEKSGPR